MPPRLVRPATGAKADPKGKDSRNAKSTSAKATGKAKAKGKAEAEKPGGGLAGLASMMTAVVSQTVKKTPKRVDPQAVANARFDLSVATRDLMLTRAQLVPLRKELKNFRPKAKLVIDDHRVLEEDVEELKREMHEMRERHQLAVMENAEHKDQIRGGEEEVAHIRQVVKDAYQEISDLEAERGRIMAGILLERKKIEGFIGYINSFEHELRDIQQDHNMLKTHVVGNEEECVEMRNTIARERKEEMNVHIDLCEALKRKQALIRKIPKWERVRFQLKEEQLRREQQNRMKERVVAAVSKENRRLKKMLVSAVDRNKFLEERVILAERVQQELAVREEEVARVALTKRPSLAMLGALGCEDPAAVAAHEYMKTGNDQVFAGATIKPDHQGRPSLVLDPHAKADAHHHGAHHGPHHGAHHGPHHGAHHGPQHAAHGKLPHTPETSTSLEFQKHQLSPVVEEDSSDDDSSGSSSSSGPGLKGGAAIDEDGLPVYWAGITEWDSEDELLMRELLENASGLQENTEHQAGAEKHHKKERRRRTKGQETGKAESRRRKVTGKRGSKESNDSIEIAEDGSDSGGTANAKNHFQGRRGSKKSKENKENAEVTENGSDEGSTKYASGSEVTGLSVYSLNDDTGSSWPEML